MEQQAELQFIICTWNTIAFGAATQAQMQAEALVGVREGYQADLRSATLHAFGSKLNKYINIHKSIVQAVTWKLLFRRNYKNFYHEISKTQLSIP